MITLIDMVDQSAEPQNIFQAVNPDPSLAPTTLPNPMATNVIVDSSSIPPISAPAQGLPPAGENGSVVAAESKGKAKIILIIVGIILVILALVFSIFKFVIPIFSGKGEGAKKEVTVNWWGLWENETNITPIISEFEANHPNIKIKYVKESPQDYRERLINAMAKGNAPDIFRFHNTWVPMFKSELDPVPANVMSAETFNSTYYPVMISDLSLGSGFAGIPMMYDGMALFINEEIFSTYGKEIPKTWDDLRQTAIDLTIKDEKGAVKQSGVSLGRTENVDHWQEILALLMIQNGVKMTNPQGKNAEDALLFFTNFSSVDGVWDETLPSSTIAFAGGKLAMYFGPSWRLFEIKEQNPSLKFRVVSVPQLAKADPTDPDINYASYWAEGVWKRSKSKVEAWEFLKFLSTRENVEKLYTSESQTRLFGELYPRVDMATLLSVDPIAGAFIAGAQTSQSWYLQSRTYDGPTGINSQIGKYFEDAVNGVNAGAKPDDALLTVASGVNQVLSNYGLTSTP